MSEPLEAIGGGGLGELKTRSLAFSFQDKLLGGREYGEEGN